jgi:hypothetical protein
MTAALLAVMVALATRVEGGPVEIASVPMRFEGLALPWYDKIELSPRTCPKISRAVRANLGGRAILRKAARQG